MAANRNSQKSATPTASKPKGKPQTPNPSQKNRFREPEYVKVHRSKLIPHPDNPRLIDDYAAKGLRKSIKDHGLVQPIVWNEQTGHVIGGHQRLSQTDDIQGNEDYSLTVAKVSLTAEQEDKLLVVLNSEEIQGDWDIDLFDSLAQRIGMEGMADAGFASTTGIEALYESCGVAVPEWMGGEPQDSRQMADETENALNEFADENDDIKAAEKEQRSSKKRTEEEIQEYKDKKKRQGESDRFKAQTNVTMILAFPTEESASLFMEEIGEDPAGNFIDGVKLAERLGIDLGLPTGEDEPEPAPKKRKPAKAAKR
jgi:hypothetical protein